MNSKQKRYYGFLDPTIPVGAGSIPPKFPTFEAPSSGHSFSPSKSLYVAGEPIDLVLTVSLNRGKILGDIVEGIWEEAAVQAPRAGAVTDVVYETVSYPNGEIPLTAYTPSFGTNAFPYELSYAAGVQPVDSKGENYDVPYPAGQIIDEASFEAVYAIYSVEDVDGTQTMANTLHAIGANAYNTQSLTFILAKEEKNFETNEEFKHRFLIPKAWDDTLSGVEILQYDAVFNKDYVIERDDIVKQPDIVTLTLDGQPVEFVEYKNTDANIMNSIIDIKINFTYL